MMTHRMENHHPSHDDDENDYETSYEAYTIFSKCTDQPQPECEVPMPRENEEWRMKGTCAHTHTRPAFSPQGGGGEAEKIGNNEGQRRIPFLPGVDSGSRTTTTAVFTLDSPKLGLRGIPYSSVE